MNQLFNTVFENSLRILILLDVMQKPQDIDKIHIIDFMIIYGKVFKITDVNLNGDNALKFSEFISRRSLVQKVLKQLVLDGLVKCVDFLYSITPEGKRYCHSLTSAYAKQYRLSAEKAVTATDKKDTFMLFSEINKFSRNERK